MKKLLKRPRSRLLIPGPRRMERPELPNSPNAAVLNHSSTVPPPAHVDALAQLPAHQDEIDAEQLAESQPHPVDAGRQEPGQLG